MKMTKFNSKILTYLDLVRGAAAVDQVQGIDREEIAADHDQEKDRKYRTQHFGKTRRIGHTVICEYKESSFVIAC